MTSNIDPAVIQGHDSNAAYVPFDVEAIHRETLPDKLTTLHEILPTLKNALEGSWAYASLGTQKVGFVHPVFTRRGDFVLELYPHEQGMLTKFFTTSPVLICYVKLQELLLARSRHRKYNLCRSSLSTALPTSSRRDALSCMRRPASRVPRRLSLIRPPVRL